MRHTGVVVVQTCREEHFVKIAKPMLLVTTPLGVIEGVYECYKLAGGLVFIMLAMLGVMSWAAVSVVLAVRREQARPGRDVQWKS
jgi:hypothetical protein